MGENFKILMYLSDLANSYPNSLLSNKKVFWLENMLLMTQPLAGELWCLYDNVALSSALLFFSRSIEQSISHAGDKFGSAEPPHMIQAPESYYFFMWSLITRDIKVIVVSTFTIPSQAVNYHMVKYKGWEHHPNFVNQAAW